MHWTTWLWARLLLAADRLLGTRLLERELARRQVEIARLVTRMEQVDQALDALAEENALCQLALCLVGLKARSERAELDDWLRFAPHNDGDESLLDSAVECLVKPQLATIDVEPAGPGNYSYCLHPDWSAIVGRLNATVVSSELLAWLEQQM